MNQPEYCVSKRHGSITATPNPIEDRCVRQFVWWSSPYERYDCGSDATYIAPGQDYLLPYWMGRYFGFIDPSW